MKFSDWRKKLLSIGAALLVWQLAASLVRLEILFPTPVEVAKALLELVTTRDFWQTVLFSLLRIAAGFTIAFVLANLLAFPAARHSWLAALLSPYVVTIKTVPVASFIILCLIWLRGSSLPTFISFLMVFPLLYTNLLEGIRHTDRKLLEMAQVFRVPERRRLRYIYLPQVRPYLLSASNVGLGMAWKSGIAAEVIAIVSGSLGSKLYEAKINLEVPRLLAWTVVIVAASVAMEKLVMALLRLAFRRLCGGEDRK